MAGWYCTGADRIRPVEGNAPVLFNACIKVPEVVACRREMRRGGRVVGGLRGCERVRVERVGGESGLEGGLI